MWGRPWMLFLLFCGASAAALLLIAGVNRLRLIPRQARIADRAVSAIIGSAVIAGGLYVIIAIVRYLLRRPEWLT